MRLYPILLSNDLSAYFTWSEDSGLSKSAILPTTLWGTTGTPSEEASGANFNTLTEDIADINNDIIKAANYKIPIYDIEIKENAYIHYNDGTETQYENSYSTDFIPISPNTRIMIKNIYLLANRSLCEYDIDKNFIKSVIHSSDLTTYEFTTTDKTRYIRYTIKNKNYNPIIDIKLLNKANLIISGNIIYYNNIYKALDADNIYGENADILSQTRSTVGIYEYIINNIEILQLKQYDNILLLQPFSDIYINNYTESIGFLNTIDTNFDTSTIYGALQSLYLLLKTNQPKANIKFASMTHTKIRNIQYNSYINIYKKVASFYNCTHFDLFNTAGVNDYYSDNNIIKIGIGKNSTNHFISTINNMMNYNMNLNNSTNNEYTYIANRAYKIYLFNAGYFDDESNLPIINTSAINSNHFITNIIPNNTIYSITPLDANYIINIHYYYPTNNEYLFTNTSSYTKNKILIASELKCSIEVINRMHVLNSVQITDKIEIKTYYDFTKDIIEVPINDLINFKLGRYDANFKLVEPSTETQHTLSYLCSIEYMPEYITKIKINDPAIKACVIGKNKNNNSIIRNYWMTIYDKYDPDSLINNNNRVSDIYELDHTNYKYKIYCEIIDEKFYSNYKILNGITCIYNINNYKNIKNIENTNLLIDSNKEMIKRIMLNNYNISYANSIKPIAILNPYNNIQNVHPKVIYDKDEIFGHAYWMAYTPYDFGRVAHENPCIAYSDDGYNFTTIDQSPIDDNIDIENSCYNSDAHLLYNYNTNTLECYYRYVLKSTSSGLDHDSEIIYRMASIDGINWDDKQIAYQSDKGSAVLSPAVLYDYNENKYKIWCIGSEKIIYFESQTGLNWQVAKDYFTLDFNYNGINNTAWHLDVEYINGQYIMLIMTKGDQWILYQSESADGLNWSTPHAIITPIPYTLQNAIYRSCIIKVNNYLYRIYYSARNGGLHHLFITESTDMIHWIGLF